MTHRLLFLMLMIAGLFMNDAFSQKNLLGIKDFQEPLGDWIEAGDVKLDSGDSTKLNALVGEGVLHNGEKGRTVHLITNEAHGDLKLKLEFMVPRGSNFGVCLTGKYEIQVIGRLGRDKMVSGDCGGIYQRWDENRQG
ncbi:MAG: DUF1080 domain-containing protein, partial [Bacteroidetes bacterium]|nr:DUF1080 domain-containing protein [Bacteroidota bacterium]